MGSGSRRFLARSTDSPMPGPAERLVHQLHPLLRLALGNDAIGTIAESLDSAKTELAAWERVGRSAAFD